MKLDIPILLNAILDKNEETFLSYKGEKEEYLFTDIDGKSLLINAIIYNLPSIISSLINIPVLVQKGDKKGKAPLHYCALKNDFKTALLLLEKGVNVDILDNFGNTPLWRATFEAKETDYEIIYLLLKYGANPKIKNNNGISAFDFASKIEDEKLTKLYHP